MIAAALAGPPLLVALVVLLARWASVRRRDADEAHRNVLALLADQADTQRGRTTAPLPTTWTSELT